MLRRILNVLVYTGIGQLLSFAVLMYTAHNVSDEFYKQVATIDNLMLVVLSLIAFGHQTKSGRDLVKYNKGNAEIRKAQSTRFSLSILLSVGMFSYLYIEDLELGWLLVACVPIAALNMDYMLYSTNKPVTASKITFLKTVIVQLALAITVYFDFEVYIYIYGIFLSLIFSCICSSRSLNVPIITLPNINFIKEYYASRTFAYTTLSLSAMRSLIPLQIIMYLSPSESSSFYSIVKIYLLFILLRRLMNNAFYTIVHNNMHGKISRYFSLFGCICFSILIESEGIFRMIFKGKLDAINNSNIYIIFSILILTIYIFPFSTTKLNLIGQEKQILHATILGSVVFFIGLAPVIYFEQKTAIYFLFLLATFEFVMHVSCAVYARKNNIEISFIDVKKIAPAVIIVLGFSQLTTFGIYDPLINGLMMTTLLLLAYKAPVSLEKK